jgi:hypothetical protein
VKLRRITIAFLAITGATTVGLLAAGVGWFVLESHRQHDPGPADLAYIINWADLNNSAKIAEVVHSYASERHVLSDDYVKAYCIRLDKPPVFELEKTRPERSIWVRAPTSDPLLVQAVETAALFVRKHASWFPETDALNSPRFMLSFPQITAYHGQVEAVDLTAYDTEDHLLYHAEVRW